MGLGAPYGCSVGHSLGDVSISLEAISIFCAGRLPILCPETLLLPNLLCLYSQSIPPCYLNHLLIIYDFLFVGVFAFPDRLSRSPSPETQGSWNVEQMFPSCEHSTVSQAVSLSRCAVVCLPFPLLLYFLYKHQIAAFFLEKIQVMMVMG